MFGGEVGNVVDLDTRMGKNDPNNCWEVCCFVSSWDIACETQVLFGVGIGVGVGGRGGGGGNGATGMNVV